MLLWVTLGSSSPGVQLGSGNPSIDLQLPAGRGEGRLNAAPTAAAVALGAGGGGAGLAVVATFFVQPVLSENVIRTGTIALGNRIIDGPSSCMSRLR